MKKLSILSLTLASSAIVFLSSCALDPGYQEYKAQQAAATATNTATNAVTSAVNSATNPYGVPQASGEVGTYTPTPSTGGGVPFQPLPGVSQSTPSTYVPSTPAVVTPSATASGSSYTVIPGDSLWKISREFGTTVEELQAANGLTTTGIRSGQSLIIPGR